MTNSAQQRSVLVTGVGKPGNLAQALLHAFSEHGDTLFAVGRRLDDVEKSLAEVRGRGGKAHAFAAELASAESIDTLMRAVGTMTDGRLDVLVHAAGKYSPFGRVADGTLEGWQRAFADNATSAFLITHRALPMLRAAHGTIVYMASVVGQGTVSPAGMANYAAGKAALVQLMHAVADEERGIVRANAIAPGGIKTAEMLAAVGDAPGLVTPQAVAAKVLYLCGPDSAETTGQVLPMP
ncbi:MAG: SDR family oxidoreductase [Burkholderiaceae bacterium]